ncbi:probable rRNA-processing protein EBP2 homolog [Culicoides brevitarsis]|uniref:probable rRNA-processing protein EBP2 homolog n=1 Tax=Culicoides brevitarsis TaxID=469753 RepID=UPI00307C12B2
MVKIKRKFKPESEESASESEYSSDYDSDAELQKAFNKGLIKPGLNVVENAEEPSKRVKVYNKERLNAKYEKLVLKMSWIERLDLTSNKAPMAPEMAVQIEREEQKRANLFKGNHKIPYVAPEVDPVLNDFKREIEFQRQAQGAVIEGMSRLHELKIETKRPDDYFAEMAKTDEHMQKVRKFLMAKQEGQQKSERVRQLREQRKMAKILQKQANEKKAAEKKKMLDEVKAFRKGKLKNLDFLNDDKEAAQAHQKPKKKQLAKGKPKVSAKRQARDAKYGFGGKKRGSKRNTAESHLGINKRTMKKGAKPQRAGKAKRAQQKNRSNNKGGRR